jgi:biofilm PGA synthesis lipoprotein PgaB
MRNLLLALLVLMFAFHAEASEFVPDSSLLVLAYHDVRDDVGLSGDRDPDATSTDHLIQHFDWLKANGYRVVSLDQVIAARQGGMPLPPHAV